MWLIHIFLDWLCYFVSLKVRTVTTTIVHFILFSQTTSNIKLTPFPSPQMIIALFKSRGMIFTDGFIQFTIDIEIKLTEYAQFCEFPPLPFYCIQKTPTWIFSEWNTRCLFGWSQYTICNFRFPMQSSQ